MKHRFRMILFTVLVLGWMGVIFVFSSQDAEESSKTSDRVTERVVKVIKPSYERLKKSEKESFKNQVTFFVRKGAHFTEYAILGLLLFGLFREIRSGKTAVPETGRLFVASWVMAVLYAAGDEFHQSFSAGRSPQVTDVCIDAAGAAAGIAVAIFAVSVTVNALAAQEWGR